METVPVSRTIGQGRVVEALIRRVTHAIRMDWLLPGIAPTGTRGPGVRFTMRGTPACGWRSTSRPARRCHGVYSGT
jgi:hypothetical protein